MAGEQREGSGLSFGSRGQALGSKHYKNLYVVSGLGGNSGVCCLLSAEVKRSYLFLKILTMELSCDPAMPLLGIYPKELNAGTQTDIRTATCS